MLSANSINNNARTIAPCSFVAPLLVATCYEGNGETYDSPERWLLKQLAGRYMITYMYVQGY